MQRTLTPSALSRFEDVEDMARINVIGWMIENGIEGVTWKVTDKSLVYYDLNGKRTIVPLDRIRQEMA